MIIWGYGKVTRNRIGGVFKKKCEHCNVDLVWELCKRTTWFTLFFIPIIPYQVVYCIECPICGSYIEITKERFLMINEEIMRKRESGCVTYDTYDTYYAK